MKVPFHLFFRQNWNPTRFVAVGFALIILLGAALLHLPMASVDGSATPWLSCLFTATSAACVTGLAVVDTALHWSVFGQGVILILIQLGGLGFVTLFTLVSLALNRRIGLIPAADHGFRPEFEWNGRCGASGASCLDGYASVGRGGSPVAVYPVYSSLRLGEGIWKSVFHSVSAFCNAGFDLMGQYSGPFSSLAAFSADPVVLLVLGTLIVAGGLGFFVWEDCLRSRSWRRLSLYSKLVLGMTGALLLLGWIFFLWVEWDNPATLGTMPVGEKVLNALFQSVTLRTAGYSVLDQALMTDSSAVMSILLMLVGGSSGSTAGGIKTVTVCVLLLALRDELRGRGEVVCRGRTIPHRKVLSAMTLTLVVTLLFLTGSMILSLIDGLPFLSASFEIASALATVGLSMGVTPQLSWSSVLLVTGMMYLGRVGILSFSLAFLTRRERDSKLKLSHHRGHDWLNCQQEIP